MSFESKKNKSPVREYEQLQRDNYFAYVFAANNDGIDLQKQEPRYIPTKLHRFLCSEVQEFVEEENKNPYNILLISVPPQTGKSISITQALPSWYLGKHQDHRVIVISYGDSFAKKFGKANKEKIEKFGYIFGTGLSRKTRSVTDWSLSNERGGMMSRGALSGVTGNPAELLIVDDPIKTREEANSEIHRAKLWDEWLSSWKTRVSPGGKIIIIQTRWHEDDLYGRLKDDAYAKVINIECINESENDPLGREIGEGICPEIGKDTKWCENYKKALVSGTVEDDGGKGLSVWESLYQGRPTIKGGNIVKSEWWQYYNYHPEMKFSKLLMSVDATFRDTKTSDYVVITIWGKIGPNIYLIHMLRRQMGFSETLRVILTLNSQYNPRTVLVEAKANGDAIIDALRRKISGVVAVEPKGGKISRAEAVSYVIESQNVFLPLDKQFTNVFLNEWKSFPNGKHDDIVDSTTQALARLVYIRADYEEALPVKRYKPLASGKGDIIHVV